MNSLFLMNPSTKTKIVELNVCMVHYFQIHAGAMLERKILIPNAIKFFGKMLSTQITLYITEIIIQKKKKKILWRRIWWKLLRSSRLVITLIKLHWVVRDEDHPKTYKDIFK